MPLYTAVDLTATIAANGSLSSAVHLDSRLPCRIDMPAAWDEAPLTFQVSTDGVNYADLYDQSGNEYTVTAAAGRAIALTPSDFFGANYIKVRSGPASPAVPQTAARTLTIVAI